MGEITLTQIPEAFTTLQAGEHLIELHTTDEAGNSRSCEFQFTLLERGNVSLDFKEVVWLFPVPANNEVTSTIPMALRSM